MGLKFTLNFQMLTAAQIPRFVLRSTERFSAEDIRFDSCQPPLTTMHGFKVTAHSWEPCNIWNHSAWSITCTKLSGNAQNVKRLVLQSFELVWKPLSLIEPVVLWCQMSQPPKAKKWHEIQTRVYKICNYGTPYKAD